MIMMEEEITVYIHYRSLEIQAQKQHMIMWIIMEKSGRVQLKAGELNKAN